MNIIEKYVKDNNKKTYLGGNYSNFETIDSALGRLSGNYLYDYFGIEV